MVTNQVIPAFLGLKDFLNTFANNEGACEKADRIPAASIYEVEQGYELEVELPGVKKEDLDISFESKLLTVSGTRKRGEQSFSYKREFRVSDEVDMENVKATFEDGVLKLVLQKKQQPSAKKIQVM